MEILLTTIHSDHYDYASGLRGIAALYTETMTSKYNFHVDLGEASRRGTNATAGHHKDVEVMVVATDGDGRPYMGDPGWTLVDGYSPSPGCTKNTSSGLNGTNTHFEETEDKSNMSLYAVESSAT